MKVVVSEGLLISSVSDRAEDHFKSAAFHVPWLEQRVEESASMRDSLGNDLMVSILKNFKSVQFIDKGSTFCRLFISLSYNVKVFLKSTSEIFKSFEGAGIELMGLKGICVEDRAPLIADSLAPGERHQVGFTMMDEAIEPRRYLPMYSNWMVGKLGKCIPDSMLPVSLIIYEM